MLDLLRQRFTGPGPGIRKGTRPEALRINDMTSFERRIAMKRM
jgi:hypothetical protein